MTTPRPAISKWTWARVMAQYNFACASCKEAFLDGERVDLDHIWQRAMGGPDTADNLRPLHPRCHAKKSAADSYARAKVRHLTGANKAQPSRSIQSRGFAKPSKPHAWASRKLPTAPFRNQGKAR